MTAVEHIKEALDSPAVAALCWALFHSLWQGLLFAGLAGLVLMSTKNATSAFRYNIMIVLLFSLLITFVVTFLYEYAVQPENTGILQVQMKALPGIRKPDGVFKSISVGSRLSAIMGTLAGFISRQASFIVMLWLVVLISKTTLMIFTLGYSRRIVNQKSNQPAPHWNSKFKGLCKQLSVSKPVIMLETALLKAPAVYGHFKPVIFIPIGFLTQLPAGQVEAILLHELAHIRRNDYLFNLLQNIAEMLFFFNPALLWLSSHIREEREHCCDDLAIAQTRNRRQYVEALISFKELSLRSQSPYAIAITGAKSGLVNRVRRLVSKQNHTLTLTERGSLLGGLLIVLLLFSLYKRPVPPAYAPPPGKKAASAFPLGKVIINISDDLEKNGLIRNKNGLCFELTNSQLLVNGVRQPEEVRKKLVDKYFKASPYPIKPEYLDNAGFGIFYNAVTHVFGIGTRPPDWGT